MKLVKSLLLGTAAGFAAVAGAQAADLPSRKAAPVEYVRVCTAYGAGFFYIPGTDTCLRVGGRVRAEYTFGERWSRGQDSYGTRARGRLNIDARTATAYGTLRTFIRYDVTTSTGSYGYNGANNGINRWSNGAGTTSASGLNLDKGFIQFGPITAGKAQSFFDFYADDYGFSYLRKSERSPTLLAYTATFGSGFSATISLEDPATTGRLNAVGAYKGTTMPDIVGSLNVTQGWGSAQLSGAIANRGTYSPITGASTDKTGFAVQGGVKVNLPFLAAGDALFVQAAYAEGAVEYLGWGAAGGRAGVGRLPTYFVSNYGVDINGSVKATTGFNVMAALRHYWTPTIRSDVYASYSELRTADFRADAVTGVARRVSPKELIAGTALVWSPVSGLDIGVEVLYSRVEYGVRVPDAKSQFYGLARSIKSDDAWSGRLRIQRDF